MKRILIIDDEAICLDQVELFLNGKYEVIKAETGYKGLEILANEHANIDLILLDLMLPDISGIDILKKKAENKDWDRIKVIMQTGAADRNMINECSRRGAVEILIKPFRRAELIEVVAKYS